MYGCRSGVTKPGENKVRLEIGTLMGLEKMFMLGDNTENWETFEGAQNKENLNWLEVWKQGWLIWYFKFCAETLKLNCSMFWGWGIRTKHGAYRRHVEGLVVNSVVLHAR